MPRGKPAIFDQNRTVANFKLGMTCTAIAHIEGVHRSVIIKFLKARGFTVIPSRATGPSKNYNAQQRISRARAKMERAQRTLAILGAVDISEKKARQTAEQIAEHFGDFEWGYSLTGANELRADLAKAIETAFVKFRREIIEKCASVADWRNPKTGSHRSAKNVVIAIRKLAD